MEKQDPQRARQEYLDKHGSFLYCEKKDTLCVHMDGMWLTGCERDRCVLDDPEYKELQRRIEENRLANAREHQRKREEEKKDPPAPIRNQSREYEKTMWNRIHALEKTAERLYRSNKPKPAEAAMHKAIHLRKELRGYLGGVRTQPEEGARK